MFPILNMCSHTYTSIYLKSFALVVADIVTHLLPFASLFILFLRVILGLLLFLSNIPRLNSWIFHIFKLLPGCKYLLPTLGGFFKVQIKFKKISQNMMFLVSSYILIYPLTSNLIFSCIRHLDKSEDSNFQTKTIT